MFVAKRYLLDLVKIHRKHPVPTDGGTWYPMACKFLKLKHHLHFFYKEEKSIIERTMQYIKDGAKCIDDYFPCKGKNCKLMYIKNWVNLFVNYHNKEMINAKLTAP